MHDACGNQPTAWRKACEWSMAPRPCSSRQPQKIVPMRIIKAECCCRQELPRLAIVSTAVPPASSGQARVRGEILAPGTVPAPVWFSDRLDLVEAEPSSFGRHVSLTPARFLLAGTKSDGALGRANNVGG